MIKIWLGICLLLLTPEAFSQTFDVSRIRETHEGHIGNTVKAPLAFHNKSDKPVTLILRRIETTIGSTQKCYLCIDDNCLDPSIEDYIIKVDPGQTLQNFYLALEAGLVSGSSYVKYLVYNKSNPGENHEINLTYNIIERPEKSTIYTSRAITINDVYPNPVHDFAHIDYRILDERAKAKIVIHNILGNPLGEYELPALDSKIKIRATELNAGIYFYTLYIDGEGVMTRKLIIRK